MQNGRHGRAGDSASIPRPVLVPGQCINNILLRPESLDRVSEQLLSGGEPNRTFLDRIELDGFDGTNLSMEEYMAFWSAMEIVTRRGFDNGPQFRVGKAELYETGGISGDCRGGTEVDRLLNGYFLLSTINRPLLIKWHNFQPGKYNVIGTYQAYLRLSPFYEGIAQTDVDALKHSLDVQALRKADAFFLWLNPLFLERWGEYYCRFPNNPARVIREYLREYRKGYIKRVHFEFLSMIGRNRQHLNEIGLEKLIARLCLQQMRVKRGISQVIALIEDELFELAEFAGWIEGRPQIGTTLSGDRKYIFNLSADLKHARPKKNRMQSGENRMQSGENRMQSGEEDELPW